MGSKNSGLSHRSVLSMLLPWEFSLVILVNNRYKNYLGPLSLNYNKNVDKIYQNDKILGNRICIFTDEKVIMFDIVKKYWDEQNREFFNDLWNH